MDLGNFSVSLTVKDLAAAREFYEKLGFEPLVADQGDYAILCTGTTVVGLFQGMFDRNILTFNPGWDHNGKNTDPYTDVRRLAAALRARGLELIDDNTAEAETGPASFVVVDPDGNPVLFDQHR